MAERFVGSSELLLPLGLSPVTLPISTAHGNITPVSPTCSGSLAYGDCCDVQMTSGQTGPCTLTVTVTIAPETDLIVHGNGPPIRCIASAIRRSIASLSDWAKGMRRCSDISVHSRRLWWNRF